MQAKSEQLLVDKKFCYLDSPTNSRPFSQGNSEFIAHVDPVDGAQGTAHHMDSESGQKSDVEEMSERNHDHSTTQGDDESIHADQGTLVSHLEPKIIKMKYFRLRLEAFKGLKV